MNRCSYLGAHLVKLRESTLARQANETHSLALSATTGAAVAWCSALTLLNEFIKQAHLSVPIANEIERTEPTRTDALSFSLLFPLSPSIRCIVPKEKVN